MDSDTAQRLIELNREFYTRFGAEFSATRQRLQPGVKRALADLRGDEQILDIGCGNGELARELHRRNFRGSYLGLDFSAPLLESASAAYSFGVQFAQADLTSPGWYPHAPRPTYHVIYAFAVLHHIPSIEIRLNLLRVVKSLLHEGGRFILSNWQFLNSAKLRARIQPWGLANLRAADVDENDYLLDWRSGGNGLRYAHHFSPEELSALADQAGMKVCSAFLSDGEGGNLGLYQIWEGA